MGGGKQEVLSRDVGLRDVGQQSVWGNGTREVWRGGSDRIVGLVRGNRGGGRRQRMDGASPEAQIREQLCLQSVGQGVAEHCYPPPTPRPPLCCCGTSWGLCIAPCAAPCPPLGLRGGGLSPFLAVTKGCLGCFLPSSITPRPALRRCCCGWAVVGVSSSNPHPAARVSPRVHAHLCARVHGTAIYPCVPGAAASLPTCLSFPRYLLLLCRGDVTRSKAWMGPRGAPQPLQKLQN